MAQSLQRVRDRSSGGVARSRGRRSSCGSSMELTFDWRMQDRVCPVFGTRWIACSTWPRRMRLGARALGEMLLLDWKPRMPRASLALTTLWRGPTTWWAWSGRRAARGFARGSRSASASLGGSWYGRRASAPASTSELGKRGFQARTLAGCCLRGTRVKEPQHPGPGVLACPKGPVRGWRVVHAPSVVQRTKGVGLPSGVDCMAPHSVGSVARSEPRGYRFGLHTWCHGVGRGTWQIGRSCDSGWGSDQRGAGVSGASCPGLLKCPWCVIQARTEAGLMNHVSAGHKGVALTGLQAQFFRARVRALSGHHAGT